MNLEILENKINKKITEWTEKDCSILFSDPENLEYLFKAVQDEEIEINILDPVVSNIIINTIIDLIYSISDQIRDSDLNEEELFNLSIDEGNIIALLKLSAKKDFPLEKLNIAFNSIYELYIDSIYNLNKMPVHISKIIDTIFIIETNIFNNHNIKLLKEEQRNKLNKIIGNIK